MEVGIHKLNVCKGNVAKDNIPCLRRRKMESCSESKNWEKQFGINKG